MNPNYNLIPGTNQLILKHPDQGSALFRKYGYDIKRPTHRDYYNALRHRQNGQAFFQDLGAILTGLSGVLMASKSNKAPAAKATTATGNSSALSKFLDNPVNRAYALDQVENMSFTGPDHSGHRARAYRDLMAHLAWQSRRDPRYFVPVAIPYGAGFPGQQAQLPIGDDSGSPEIDQQSFFERHKVMILVVAAVSIGLLYFKHRK